LDDDLSFDNHKIAYQNYRDNLELLCFCLMPNHFHLLFFQINEKSLQVLMQGVMTSYSRYFNKKYSRRGPLFESRYKSSLISNQSYLEHIVRYILLNPKKYEYYPYSSIAYHFKSKKAGWLRDDKILDLFNDKNDFEKFLADYVDYKNSLDVIKYDLANDII
jgi:putative transposase